MPPEDTRVLDVSSVVAWLVGPDAPSTMEALFVGVGERLLERGVRLARTAAFVRALDPSVMGWRFVWKRGSARLEVKDAPYALLQATEFLESPSGQVFSTRKEARWRLLPDAPLPYDALVEQRDAGLTDYFAAPIHFLSGEVHTATYSTDAPDGFNDAELEAFRQVTRPLARVVEILQLKRTAATLLDVYVGHNAGERILSGRVRRGETELIDCVIWFSDLRGFTNISSGQPPSATVELLNKLFDCQVPSVERHGGEVLKFIGDGMLAIFPVPDPSRVREVMASALSAAKLAFVSLDAWNEERAREGEKALSFGLAIHVGEVGYGNIGGAGRLDFTCIGAAVNLASRVEGLTGKLGKRVLLTEAAADRTDAATRLVGAYEVKGVETAPVVYELSEAWASAPASRC